MRPHVVQWLASFLPSGAASVIAPTWFTCVGLAGVVCLFALSAIARRDRIPTRVVASIVLWCYVAAVIAGIVMPATIDMIQHAAATGELRVRWAGMTSFWGYLAGITAVIAVCRAHRIPVARLGDLAAAPMGLALFCARIGCFLAGCDYGKVTSVPWAVRFPAGSPAWTDQLHAGLLPPEHAASLPVHPTQLYEAGLGLLMFAVGLALVRAPRGSRRGAWLGDRNGRVFLTCAALYAVGRIAIETVRADLGRGVYGGMSSGQIFSVIVLLVVGATWLATRRRAGLLAVAASAVALLLAEPHAASAQPAPQPAQPARPAQPAQPAQPAPPPQQPYPYPYPPPQQPYPYPPQQPYPYPYPPQQPYPYPPPQQPYPAQPPQPIDTGAPAPIEIGALVGIAVPINRRADQVPALAGVTVSAGYDVGPVGLWIDVDGYTNNEAAHRSGLLSASLTHAHGRWSYGARFGLGFTTVTFNETAFGSATGSLVRVEGLAEYRIGAGWTLWGRFSPFDLVTSAELGGTILTYQMRIGVAYRFGGKRALPPPPPVAPAAPPVAAPPPAAAPPPPASAAPPPVPTARSQP